MIDIVYCSLSNFAYEHREGTFLLGNINILLSYPEIVSLSALML